MFFDDELLEQLVLKGGNAMALVHRVSARASVDLDFSMPHDFGEAIGGMTARIEKTLTSTFRESGFEVFDFKMIEKPKAISEDKKQFGGGYGVEFKLVTAENYAKHQDSLDDLRASGPSIWDKGPNS